MARIWLILSLAFACVPGSAQTEFHRNHILVGGGPAFPVGRSADFFGTGLQFVWGAAKNQNAVIPEIGEFRGGDREFVIPFGGSVILTLPPRPIETSIGVANSYLHESETVPSTRDSQNTCNSRNSRRGWGSYGLDNASYFMESDDLFHVGATLQVVRDHTKPRELYSPFGRLITGRIYCSSRPRFLKQGL